MNTMTRLTLLNCALFCSTLLFANNRIEHFKVWGNTPITGSLSKDEKWNYYIEPQLRLFDDKYKFNQLNLFLGVFYQADAAFSFYLGVYRSYEQLANGNKYQEERLWEQLSWNIVDSDRYNLLSRTRIEERKAFGQSRIANRVRERLTLQLPVNKAGDHFLVFADEVFLQFNKPDWVLNSTFAQNRASVGFLLPFGKNSTIEFGYLNQYQYTSPAQMSNILYMTLCVDLG